MKGRVIALTGAAGGIGRAISLRLAGRGATLALIDRDRAGLENLAAELKPSTPSIHVLDLRRFGDYEELASTIVSTHGGVDVLINNAGLTSHGPLSAQSAEAIDRVLDVDLRAVIHSVRVFLPYLRRRPKAHVINVASMAGLQGFPFQSTYSAAKFGLRGFGQALRPELRAAGVGCSTLLPGTIATGFLRSADNGDVEGVERLADLMESYGTSPRRVAAAVERALRWNRAEVLVGWDAYALATTSRFMPGLLPRLMNMAVSRRLLGAQQP